MEDSQISGPLVGKTQKILSSDWLNKKKRLTLSSPGKTFNHHSESLIVCNVLIILCLRRHKSSVKTHPLCICNFVC